MTFFARQSSGVISLIWPCLYWDTKFFAFCSPAEDTSSVLQRLVISFLILIPLKESKSIRCRNEYDFSHFKSCCSFSTLFPSLCALNASGFIPQSLQVWQLLLDIPRGANAVVVSVYFPVKDFTYLGSAMSMECLTRPQYEPRSYLEVGGSRWPGKDEVIFNNGK